jgi:hypothetical protein
VAGSVAKQFFRSHLEGAGEGEGEGEEEGRMDSSTATHRRQDHAAGRGATSMVVVVAEEEGRNHVGRWVAAWARRSRRG